MRSLSHTMVFLIATTVAATTVYVKWKCNAVVVLKDINNMRKGPLPVKIVHEH